MVSAVAANKVKEVVYQTVRQGNLSRDHDDYIHRDDWDRFYRTLIDNTKREVRNCIVPGVSACEQYIFYSAYQGGQLWLKCRENRDSVWAKASKIAEVMGEEFVYKHIPTRNIPILNWII